MAAAPADGRLQRLFSSVYNLYFMEESDEIHLLWLWNLALLNEAKLSETIHKLYIILLFMRELLIICSCCFFYLFVDSVYAVDLCS